MRVFLILIALLFTSVVTGVAMGRYTVNGAALAAAPGPIMPRADLGDGSPDQATPARAQIAWDTLDSTPSPVTTEQ